MVSIGLRFEMEIVRGQNYRLAKKLSEFAVFVKSEIINHNTTDF